MIFGRLIGWNLFFAGFAVLVQDTLAWTDTLYWAPTRLGQLWRDLNPSSLVFAQFAVERYVWPPLWNVTIVELLSYWAFAVLMTAGVLLVYLFRERQAIAFRDLSGAASAPSWGRR